MSNLKTVELSIIIVTFNSERQITALLDSICREKGKLSLETIIVDNHSADNSLIAVRDHKLNPVSILMPTNAGFSSAVNRAISISKGEYILLLNPDTVLLKGTLEKLVSFARATDPLGAVAPRLVSPDGKPQASVFKFPSIENALRKYFLNCPECFGKYLPDNKVQKIDVAVMAALLIPRQSFDRVGLLDEKYFLYYEDVDFCRRLSLNGLPVFYFPSARVKHIHGASGHFKFHLESPLLSSARLYHGTFYSNVLNLVLWMGQKWQKIQHR